MLGIVGEWICLAKPPGYRGNQRWDEFFAYVQKSKSRRTEQILQGSRHVKVEVHRFHVRPASSAILIVIEHHEGTTVMGNLRDGFYVGAESVLETNVRERNDVRAAVNHPLVV